MLPPLLECQSLGLRYAESEAWALRHVGLVVRPGTIWGILGPNGAGKTSLLRCALGLLHPTEGQAKLFESVLPVTSEGERQRLLHRVGLHLENPGLYRHLSADEYLEHFARLQGISPRSARHAEWVGALKRAFAFEDGQCRCGKLSQGNQQKLHLMRSLLARPDLVIWDEPTDHLDPTAQDAALDLLKAYVVSGRRAAVIASHRIEHLERLCSHVLILKKGQTLVQGPIDEVTGHPRALRIAWEANPGPKPPDAAAEALTLVRDSAHASGKPVAVRACVDAELPPGASAGLWFEAPAREAADLDAGIASVGLLSSRGYRIFDVTVMRDTLAEIYHGAVAEAGRDAVALPEAHAGHAPSSPPVSGASRAGEPAESPSGFGLRMRKGWAQAVEVSAHEWRLIRREPRFLLPFLLVPLFLVAVQGLLLGLPVFGAYLPRFEDIAPILAVLGALAASMLVPLGADSLAGERERKSLEVLLSTATPSRAIFAGKALALLPLPLVLGWSSQALLLAAWAAKGGEIAAHGPAILMAMAWTPVLQLTVASLALWVAARAETVRGATQMLAPLLFLLFVGLPWAGPHLMEKPWASLAGMALALGANAWLMAQAWLRLGLGRRP